MSEKQDKPAKPVKGKGKGLVIKAVGALALLGAGDRKSVV